MAPARLPSDPVVAVCGATGLVGQVLLDVLAERDFPVGRLLPLASERSAGAEVRFRNEGWAVGEASSEALAGADLVFFAATGSLSRRLAPEAVRRGALVIDKSSTFRLDPEVALIVPEVNVEVMGEQRFVACPNCTTIGLVMALEPLRRLARLERVDVTSLQSASGAGRPGMEELARQLDGQLGQDGSVGPVFPAVLAQNAVPLCEVLEADGSSSEERKLLEETRRLLDMPGLALRATCVRVPVPVGHSLAVTVETDPELSVEEARRAFEDFPGLALRELPTAADAAGGDDVLVGRLRRPLAGPGLSFWVTSDNLRKGAALNAVQIAERWV